VHSDTIRGFAGSDSVYSLAGADLIFGGSGNDGMVAGRLNDIIHGGPHGDCFIDSGRGTTPSTAAPDGMETVGALGPSLGPPVPT
jgi:Ca2+-binding RTX toxin-like protein